MIELAIYYGLGTLVGVFAGWFSYRHQVIFVTLAGSAVAGLGVMVKLFSPVAKAAGMGFWEAVGFAFSSLPLHAQNAAIAAAIIALAARIATWFYMKYVYTEKTESRREMRERIFRETGYDDPIVQAYQVAPLATPRHAGATESPIIQRAPGQPQAQSLRSAAGLR